jgi:hypothetical protein
MYFHGVRETWPRRCRASAPSACATLRWDRLGMGRRTVQVIWPRLLQPTGRFRRRSVIVRQNDSQDARSAKICKMMRKNMELLPAN